MNLQRAVLDHAASLAEFAAAAVCAPRQETGSDPADHVLSAALLVATSFRLRDEQGLLVTLRLLANAVAAWEARQKGEESCEG